MTSRIVSIMLVYLCISVTAFGAGDESRTSRDLKQIMASGKLIVAMVDMDVPPFVTRSRNGEPGGLDADMARDIARRLEVSLDIIKVQYFDDVIDLVANGKADIGLSNLSMTCDRARRIKFTDTYRTLGITMLLNRAKIASMRLHDDGNKLEQLKNTRGPIGVLEQSAYESAARKFFPEAVFNLYKEYRELIKATERGDVLMSVGNSGTMEALVKGEPSLLVKLQPYKTEGFRDHIAIAVGLENDHLLSWLNTYLTVKNMNIR